MVAGARTQASLWPWASSGFGPLPPLLAVMTVVTGIVGLPVSSWQRYALVTAIALAMGVQNAMARSLAVPT